MATYSLVATVLDHPITERFQRVLPDSRSLSMAHSPGAVFPPDSSEGLAPLGELARLTLVQGRGAVVEGEDTLEQEVQELPGG